MNNTHEQWLGAAAHTDKNIEAGYGCGGLSGDGYSYGRGHGFGLGYGYGDGWGSRTGRMH